MKRESLLVIVTGTDPVSKRGGIGFAIPGYLSALRKCEILYESIPTYHPAMINGKWWLLFKSLPKIALRVRKAQQCGVSVVVYSHAGKGFSLLREALVLYVSRFFGAKTILQLHAVEIDSYLKKRWSFWLLKGIIFSADRVCVLTAWWKNRLETSGMSGQFSVIPNPLPLAWEQKANDEHVLTNCDGRLTVLTMTRLEVGKGVELLVEAMQFVPETIRLVIAGNGSQLENLKRMVKQLCLTSSIEFVGWVSGEQKQKLLDESDIFCLPSAYDSFGMGFLEAMANGIPVIAFDWGPVADVVVDNKTGMLLKKADARILSTTIERMMDDEMRERMGRQARQWVLKQFSTQKIGSKLQNIMYHLTNV